MREFIKSTLILIMIIGFFFAWTGLDVELVDETDSIQVPCYRVLADSETFSAEERDHCLKLRAE